MQNYRLQSTTFSSRYSFSAKEKDEETGYSYFGSRYYNSALSIWLSVDPMADKYPSLSPYAYCANNPVKLVDPDGKEIWVEDNGASYRYSNGKLYNTDNSEFTPTEGSFAYKAQNALNEINNSATGSKVVSEIETSTSYNVNISYGKVSKYHPIINSSIDYVTGMVSGNATINWNSEGTEVVPTLGGVRADATMSLAHELIHGIDEKRGTMSTVPTKMNSWIGNDEWKAVFHENQIRSELGKPLRTHYQLDISNPFEPKGTGPDMLNFDKTPRLPSEIKPLF